MTFTSITRSLLNLVLCLAVGAFALFGLGPHTGQYRTLSILSDSMRPTFAAGDAIISTPLSTRDLRPGDVISYHAPVEGDPLVTHRVVKILSPGANPVIRTKGDAGDTPDPWTAQLQDGTVWKQRWSVPYAGHVIRSLRHPMIKQATVYVFPLLLVLMTLHGIWRRREQQVSEEEGDLEPIEYAGWERAA